MAPLVKICGLSTEATLDATLEAGAERVGFVFFARSPRHLTLERAAVLARRARGRAAVVALTVDAEDAALDAIVGAVAPDMVQLHGRETPERVAALRARLGRPMVKALGIACAADLDAVPAYAAVADEIMFDAKPPKGAALPGGNGVAFDWRLLAALDLPVPFMLSGGLGPRNVGEALRVTRAPAVDVSSGVESAPGVKDPDLIAAFIRAAKS
ncbi:phosphoribosylanthranilate isomerase [Lichenibacterium ramalinae]|uniref:N-(5'-phosphoribosyl)anthranilate isomerase n=1 Tax=Lichenibacterium ramalinae TaxID=2316527 RepID=A0A4V1RIH9_9HYPH|nr:phosphoribosylanthranilate isomerase [Lichenibacterium ramalinae]RYB03965.1 phosphoribosylanthranilate isomerase [Lichenibacterium ramalinae]